MSTDRETTRIVRSWLEEGRTTLPDWVRDDVMDRLPSTPQRRSGGTAWRFLTMPTAAKTAIAAAAVILVAVGAFALLPRDSGPGTPSPTPTTAPTTSPRLEPSSAIPFVPRLGLIPAGTYRMGEEASIVVALPAGWTGSAGDLYRNSIGTDIRKNRDRTGELAFWVDATDGIQVYPSVCGSDPMPVGPTVDDLVTAIRAQEGSEISEPVNVPMGGRDVQRYDISYGQGVDPADCEDGIARVWHSEASGYVSHSAGEQITDPVYMAQTDAGRIVFGFWHTDDASAADIAEWQAIIDSMVIEP